MNGEEFLNDFLENGKNQGMACDDAYETGFATLTDKEGHPYVAHLDSGTGKEGKKDKKKGEKKPESEKKTEEKSEEKIEDNEKKYKVVLGGQKTEKTKAEIKKLIDVYDKKLDENLDLLIKYKEDGIKVRQKIDNAKDVYHFWKHYRDVEANKGKTPSEYYKSSKSLWNITDKEDLDLIKNNNKNLDLMVTRGKSHLDRALNEAKYLPQTEESTRGIIRKLKDQIKSLKGTLAQDSLDTSLKNVSVAQDSALDAYFDNINLF